MVSKKWRRREKHERKVRQELSDNERSNMLCSKCNKQTEHTLDKNDGRWYCSCGASRS